MKASEIQESLDNLAEAVSHGLKWIGAGDVHEKGTLEFMGMAIEKAGEEIGGGLREVAHAIDGLAQAVRDLK